MRVNRSHVDLFSGIGGFSLACEWVGVETIAFSEIDPYAIRVLQRHWPHVRNYGRVQDFPSLSAWLLTAGVPCQPASVAGKRQGPQDDRWLWPETLAVVENGSYEWLLFENPTGILSLNDGLEFERICLALEGQGYEVQPLIIPACGVGAPHRRNRVWILAHATGTNAGGGSRQFEGQESSYGESTQLLLDSSSRSGTSTAGSYHEDVSNAEGGTERPGLCESESRGFGRRRPSGIRCEKDVQDSESARLERNECRELAQPGEGRFDTDITGSDWWSVEPDVGRLADGVSDRVGKLRCLGNAIVPQVAYQLIKRMIEAEEI